MRRSSTKVLGAIAAGAMVLLASGCREEEQDRLLFQDKGVYQGQPDDPVPAEMRARLNDRARGQRF